jgi:drug/metabolite transporter (DMT)-like permease
MKILMAFMFMISCTVLANIFLKTGATSLNSKTLSLIGILFSWRLLLGLFFFGCAALIYIVILQWLPLNVAQSFAAAQFVAVILASWIFLSEPISFTQWLGIILIAVGIFVVGGNVKLPT